MTPIAFDSGIIRSNSQSVVAFSQSLGLNSQSQSKSICNNPCKYKVVETNIHCCQSNPTIKIINTNCCSLDIVVVPCEEGVVEIVNLSSDWFMLTKESQAIVEARKGKEEL